MAIQVDAYDDERRATDADEMAGAAKQINGAFYRADDGWTPNHDLRFRGATRRPSDR
jgi:hypothetical protein